MTQPLTYPGSLSGAAADIRVWRQFHVGVGALTRPNVVPPLDMSFDAGALWLAPGFISEGRLGRRSITRSGARATSPS